MKEVHVSLFLVLVSFSALLAGCASWDAPSGLVKAAPTAHGVVPVSLHSPYIITSYSKLRPYKQALNRKMTPFRQVAKGNYMSWKWEVRRKYYKVQEASKNDGSNSIHAVRMDETAGACRQFNWDRAFRKAYELVDYLLHGPPLPLSMKINLIPAGATYLGLKGYKFHVSSSRAPLEFTFWSPSPNNSCKMKEKVQIVNLATALYEFQHLEYAVGAEAIRPNTPPLHAITDEATSTCWKISAEIVFPQGYPQIVVIRKNDADFGIYNRGVDSLLFSAKPMVKNAVPWAPLLLRYDLTEYLSRRFEAEHGLESGGFTIKSSNKEMVNVVLAYCRGFTAYNGNLITTPMPASKVSNIMFYGKLDRR